MPINARSYNVLFTDAAQLKAQSVIQENVDDKLISTVILDVQQFRLMRILGTPFYADLQDKILANTLNDDEIFVLNAYIQPILRWALVMELTNTASYQFTNKGLLQMFADSAKQPSSNDIAAVLSNAGQNFDWYAQRFIDYMGANFSKYPAYLQVQKYDDIPPTGRGYRVPFALGDGPYDMNHAGGTGDFYRDWYLLHR